VLLRVIRAIIALAQPRRLRIRNLAELSGDRGLDLLRLPRNRSNLQTRILGAEEDFMTMQTEEGLCGILSG